MPVRTALFYLAAAICLISCQAFATQDRPALEAALLPKRGLQASFNGIPIVRGSSLRFSSSDKSASYYDFSWIFQPVNNSRERTELLLGGPNSFVNGSYQMQTKDQSLTFRVKGKWQRKDSTVLRVQAGRICLPAFAGARIFFDDLSTPSDSLDGQGFPLKRTARSGLTSLRLEANTITLVLKFPASDGQIQYSSPPVNPGANRWESTPPVMDLFLSEARLAPGAEFEKSWSMSFRPGASAKKADPTNLQMDAIPADSVQAAGSEALPLLPKPKLSSFAGNRFVPLEPSGKTPAGYFDLHFSAALARLWEGPTSAFRNVKAQHTPKTLPAEGFSIRVKEGAIQVGYADSAGLRHAAQALACLARPINGRLCLPEGNLTDYPSTSWRGIHMFVGPTAPGFHREMYEKALLPFRMNKVVLQCEQTDWASQPGIKNPITMPLEGLVEEARFLSEHQIELIPLIQSFGHMEWFFENGQNLELATNPEIPYTLNVRDPRAKDALKQIWSAAAKATGATTLHFGLDEVDMIGWAQKDPEQITALWESHLPFLSEIAREHGARMMLWGDMLLAPGESVDFANAEHPEQARRRRAVIPKGALIADWHYLPEPDPRRYAPSLDILQAAGLVPVASTWFYPENILGFNLAAVQRGLGTLQTTWADFESSEANMLKYLPQFGAYLLSLDYAWSGRKELPKDLPYDPTALWASLFYRSPQPIAPKNGYFIAAPNAAPEACGAFKFRLLPPGSEKTAIKISEGASPRAVSGAALLLENPNWADEDEALATVEFHFQNGEKIKIPLRYGVHMRAPNDPRPVLSGDRNTKGRCAVFLPFPKNTGLSEVVFESTNPYGRTLLSGLTLVEAR
ncbi:MAG: hypothetical protein ACOYOO_09780 [Saprospiraceae bacterium]